MRHLFPALVLAFASVAHAQTIPKELVTLLVRSGGMPSDGFEIRFGAPPGFPRELFPRGVLPVASGTSDRTITVVAEAPDLTARELSQHERDLATAGWTNLSSMSMRGLVSSNMAPSTNLCKGDQYATMSYSQRAAGGLNVRVSITTDPRRGACLPPGQRPISSFADVDMPQLVPPAGVRMMGSGSGGGNDHYEQHVRLETTMDPKALVQHYGDQLEKAGWKRESRADGAGVALARFTIVSTTKDTVVGIVIVTPMPDGTQTDVSLQLLRVDPNRRFIGRIGGPGDR